MSVGLVVGEAKGTMHGLRHSVNVSSLGGGRPVLGHVLDDGPVVLWRIVPLIKSDGQ